VVRIDSHVHAFPDRLALAVRDRLNSSGMLTGSPLLPALAQRIRDEGFDGACVLPYAHRAGVAESINEWSAATVVGYPWLVSGATFHPADEHLGRLVERALVELGLRVVKLHCSVGQFSPKDVRLAPLWETAASLGAPVVVHAGQVSGGDTLASEVEEVVPVLRAYPRLRLVLAHTGFPAVARALELMGEHENLYGDLTPVWDRPHSITAGEIARFSGRLLFGSDAPNNPVAAGAQARRYEGMGLSTEDLGVLLGGAARGLIPAPESEIEGAAS
jgi:predicted TIM-barrel fold metal-dependent hydrolase